MGVQGLKSFIEKNNDLLIRNYQLHDTKVIIDACNLIGVLTRSSQKHERRDLFGGDLVQFGRFLNSFFDSFESCNITPILVFDGAQTYDVRKSKTKEKRRRAIEKFRSVMQINATGYGDFILPVTATYVFRLVLVQRNIKIVQCMYEADAEVARLANELNCPVISNDSDFYLMNLPHGLIPIDSLEYHKVNRITADTEEIDPGISQQYNFLLCCLFKQDNLVKCFPNLDKRTLPLLGILAGNDFVETKAFRGICDQLPLREICENYGVKTKQFRKTHNKQHEKIIKILAYFCGKSLNEIINQICSHVLKEKRSELKGFINSKLTVYDIPRSDCFESELTRIFWPDYLAKYGKSKDKDEVKSNFREVLEDITNWVRNASEKSTLTYRFLELINKNPIFLAPYMDDTQLISAHTIQYKGIEVILRLVRSSEQDRIAAVIYDREGYMYSKRLIKPRGYLEKFGPLNYLMYEVPKIPCEDRRRIALATFECSALEYELALPEYCEWLDELNAEQFLIVRLLMKCIDQEGVKLWNVFRQSVLLCMLHYWLKTGADRSIRVKLDEEGLLDSIEDFQLIIKKRRLDKNPNLSKKRPYNCRLMHQITQLHGSVVAYNMINSFLGDVLPRLRVDIWLNSCFIYNVAENLRSKYLRLSDMPSIIY